MSDWEAIRACVPSILTWRQGKYAAIISRRSCIGAHGFAMPRIQASYILGFSEEIWIADWLRDYWLWRAGSWNPQSICHSLIIRLSGTGPKSHEMSRGTALLWILDNKDVAWRDAPYWCPAHHLDWSNHTRTFRQLVLKAAFHLRIHIDQWVFVLLV